MGILKFRSRCFAAITLILIVSLKFTFSLRCWSCENAISQEDCRDGGISVRCSTGDICATEVRYHGGWGKNPRIFKRCKQELACENNRVQNNRPAWNPTQCNLKLKNSVCRCCCDSNNCNKFNLRCMKGNGICENLQTPKNGFKKCDSVEVANEIGTSCQFSCKKGFGLKGSEVSTCIKNTNGSGQVYSSKPPSCHRTAEPEREEDLRERWICEVPPEAHENVKRTCSPMKGGVIARVCRYRCKGKAVLTGSKVRRCRRRGPKKGWDGIEATCFAPTQAVCEEIEPTEHRDVACSDGINEGSTCEFTCADEAYELRPRNLSQSRCQSSGRWTEIPCCILRCPPHAAMDVVIILDSSRSIRRSGWRQMKTFVKRIIRSFTVSPDAANFGIFRFNSIADESTQILLNDFPDNKERILNSLDEIPYNGGGTKIGKALRHAKDVMLVKENGNRPLYADLVLVMTDGISTDNVSQVSNAIRDVGATIFALGIELPNKKLNKEQLLAIAGNEDNFMLVTQGVKGLTDQLVAKVSDIICGNRCM